MAKSTAEKPLDTLLNEVHEDKGWSWELFAEKVRAAGVSCTSRSLYRWAQGNSPHANNETLLRKALQKLR